MENNLKYDLVKFITPELRKSILKQLDLSRSTFHRKAHAEIGTSQGFEYFELLRISFLLKRDIKELLNPLAVNYYNPVINLS